MENTKENVGTAVIVDGAIVAWFAEWDEAAREWCTENFFGLWLTFRAKRPEIIPLTEDELVEIEKGAAELCAKFADLGESGY